MVVGCSKERVRTACLPARPTAVTGSRYHRASYILHQCGETTLNRLPQAALRQGYTAQISQLPAKLPRPILLAFLSATVSETPTTHPGKRPSPSFLPPEQVA
ncbi:hypothetical protein Hsw_1328 [Hymenobacter swuensis DY53]|uniref:Uncharacterized protein n=1 Tax=Hymenobacter swuensis DY53 TaxID=1227739 RepID=W8EWK2_9BACT|nr:hypothetical protein Hsw_1328 [Hymenobacter swuensis DY53]